MVEGLIGEIEPVLNVVDGQGHDGRLAPVVQLDRLCRQAISNLVAVCSNHHWAKVEKIGHLGKNNDGMDIAGVLIIMKLPFPMECFQCEPGTWPDAGPFC